jgi:hypothetical protein
VPRRKPKGDDQLLNAETPTLALPVLPRVAHRHEHEVDPYLSPPGAVALKSVTHEPIKRQLSALEKRQRKEAQVEQRMRTARCNRYFDALADNNGNEEQALALVYQLPIEEVRANFTFLKDDVRSNTGASTLTQVLERNELALAARVRRLRAWVYSENPAASLKALDMVGELEGTRGDVGSFEDYLRIAKSAKG